MKKTLRLALCCAVALIFAISLMACQQGSVSNDTSESNPTSSPQKTTVSPTEEVVEAVDEFYIEGGKGATLTYWRPISSTQSQYYTTLNEHPYYIWLEEKTGVHIDFVHYTSEQASTQLNMMIASGDFYDLMDQVWYPGGPQAGIDEACFTDLSPYLDEYMPTYKAAIDCDDYSLTGWQWSDSEKELYQIKAEDTFRNCVTTSDGSIWCVTMVWDIQRPAESGPIIRQDWLDEMSLEMPDTLDELEVVLEAFKQKGVIPMAISSTGYTDGFSGSGAINGAFDLNGYFSLEPDGKTIGDHMFIKPNLKEYLLLMNRWYEAGYIDPDFMNRDWDSIMSMLLNDRLGIFVGYWGDPDNYESSYTGTQSFNMEAMPLPRLTEDQTLNVMHKSVVQPSYWVTISPTCENIDIAFQWLDKSFLQESQLRAQYGVEGETYEMVNGVPQYTDYYYHNDEFVPAAIDEVLLMINSSIPYSVRSALLRTSENANEELTSCSYASQVWSQNAEENLRIPYTVFTDDDWGNMDALVVDIYTYAMPMIVKFIIGEEDIETKYDDFVQICKDMGIEEARQYWQDAYSSMIGNN